MVNNNTRRNPPYWYKFIIENIGPDWENPITKNEKILNIWSKRNKAYKEGKPCKCGGDEKDLIGLCTVCYLKIEDYKWKWIYEDGIGWLCISKELIDKMLDFKKNELVGVSWFGFNMGARYYGNYWKTIRQYFYELQNEKCGECNIINNLENMELHHIISVSKGGRESSDNLILLCKPCHYTHITESLYD